MFFLKNPNDLLRPKIKIKFVFQSAQSLGSSNLICPFTIFRPWRGKNGKTLLSESSCFPLTLQPMNLRISEFSQRVGVSALEGKYEVCSRK